MAMRPSVSIGPDSFSILKAAIAFLPSSDVYVAGPGDAVHTGVFSDARSWLTFAGAAGIEKQEMWVDWEREIILYAVPIESHSVVWVLGVDSLGSPQPFSVRLEDAPPDAVVPDRIHARFTIASIEGMRRITVRNVDGTPVGKIAIPFHGCDHDYANRERPVRARQ
jgi:hypothetical protein